MTPRTLRTLLARLVLPLCLFALGCASPPAGQAGSITASASELRRQTAEAFAAINDLNRREQIETAVGLESLSEESFPPAIDEQTSARWAAAFESLASYASLLERALGPGSEPDLAQEFARLGEQIRLSAPSLAPDPPTAGALAALGDELARARSLGKIRGIVRRADPAITAMCGTMSRAIGETSQDGLRLTCRATWAAAMARMQAEFTAAGDRTRRHALAARFASMLGDRDRQDAALAALGRSILALGRAHAALAREDAWRARGALRILHDELASARALLAALTIPREVAP